MEETVEIISSESSDDASASALTYRLVSVVRSKRSQEQKLKKIEELINNGADIDFRDANDNRNTVLHVAIRKHELKVIEFLVKSNANVHVQNNSNISALQYAEQNQSPIIVDILKGETKYLTKHLNEYLNEKADKTVKVARSPPSPRNSSLNPQKPELNETRIRNKLEEIPSKPKFKKLSDDSGASGHRFEVNLLTLFKLRGENLTDGFLLAGNLEEAGAFDDVVFKYWNQKEPKIIFLQAKHRQDPRQRLISWETFQTDKDFALTKYFATYLEVKDKFREQITDPIFRGKFEQFNCQFVILTNACLDEDRTRGLVRVQNEAVCSFRIGHGGNVIKVQSDYGVNFLMENESKNYISSVSKKFVEFVSSENADDLMARDELVKEYHVFWARTVLEVCKEVNCELFKKGKSFKERKFRNAMLHRDFLRNPIDDPLLDRFRIEVLKEVEKRNLMDKVVRVGVQFGNIDESLHISISTDRLRDQFANLINDCEKLPNTFIITKINKKLLADLSKLVGNVFIENKDTGKLKLNDTKLDGDAQVILEELTSCVKHFDDALQTEFDFQVKDFPKLSLRHSSKNAANMEDFIKRLSIFTDQPSAIGLDGTIKQELKDFYKLTDEEVHQSYLRINYKMTKWWMETGSVAFLRQGDGFLSNVVRFGIHFRLMRPTPSFTGRIQELDKLHRTLQGGCNLPEKRTVVISGLGGIGKSELAREYAADFGRHYDNNVIWIDARTSATIRYSFQTLCQTILNIPTKDENGMERQLDAVVKDVYDFFGKRKSLFIFDNAESYEDGSDDDIVGIKQFLPNVRASNLYAPCIVITSRNKRWPVGTMLQLDTFSDEEAAEFIKSFLKIKNAQQDDDVESLRKTLQNFPLALQQAVAFIREQNLDCKVFNPDSEFTIANYVQLYEGKNKDLLNFKFPEDSLDLYTTTTFKTWNITMETIERLKFGEVAIQITTVLAYLDGNYVAVEFFSSLVSDNAKRLRHCIRLLKQYSLITEHEGLINIHGLVQQVIRINLKDQQLEEPTLHVALRMVGGHTENRHIAQGVSAWKYARHYDELVKEFRTIPSTVIDALVEDVRYEEGLTFGVLSFESLRTSLGTDHSSTLSTQFRIPQIMHRQGRVNEALDLYQEVFDKEVIVFGPDNPNTLTSHNSIAQVLCDQGKYEESLKTYGEVLEKETKVMGADHNKTLWTRHQIGIAHFFRGDYDAALAIYKEVFEKFTDILGPDHPDTLYARHHMAQVWYKRGNYEEALTAFVEDLNHQTKVLGANHLSTLGTKSNIAHVLANQGKYDEALRSYREIYEKQNKILGPEHPSTLMTQNNMGQVMYKLEKYDEALVLYAEVLEKQMQILGPDHPDTLTTQHNTAQALRNQGKYEEAMRSYREVLEKRTRHWGPDHPNTLTTQHNIAQLLVHQGKYNEAWTSCNEILEKRMRLLGPDHPDTLTTQFNIAQILSNLGKHDEALTSFQEVFRKHVKVLGPDHPTTVATKYNIGEIFVEQGKHDEGLRAFREVYDQQTVIFGPDHPSTITIQYNIAQLLYSVGKVEESLRCLKEVSQKNAKVLGPDHATTIATQRNIVVALLHLNRYDEALNIYKQVFHQEVKLLGHDHETTLNTRRGISELLLAMGEYQEAFFWISGGFQ